MPTLPPMKVDVGLDRETQRMLKNLNAELSRSVKEFSKTVKQLEKDLKLLILAIEENKCKAPPVTIFESNDEESENEDGSTV